MIADQDRLLSTIKEKSSKSSDKEKFLRGQESKIILLEAAARVLKRMGVQKLSDTVALQAERYTLTVEKQKKYEV